MKLLQVSQGDPAWHELHHGRLTSSRFKTVLHGGPAAWKTLMKSMRPAAKRRDVTAASLAWGLEHEPQARREYQKLTGLRVKQVGFVVGDDPRFGVSPDGLVGRNGVVEIKCPYDSLVHSHTVRSNQLPEVYRPQVQGILWVTKRAWCDFVSFDPRRDVYYRLLVIRIDRDERYIRRLAERCDRFFELYEARRDPTKHLRVVPKLF